MEQLADGGIRVEALTADYQAKAQEWAQRLDLPVADDNAAFAVQVGESGLQIQQLARRRPARYVSTLSKARQRTDGCSVAAAGR